MYENLGEERAKSETIENKEQVDTEIHTYRKSCLPFSKVTYLRHFAITTFIFIAARKKNFKSVY